MDNQPQAQQNQNGFNQTQIQKDKGKFKMFLNLTSWVVFFALLPITVLIFLSQDSIPGDFFYPVKRSMENVILAAASVNPATRAAFTTDLTATRFKEAQSLVISKANASGLSTFVDEVQAAQVEVSHLQNPTEKANAEEKLAIKIDQYQNSLDTLQVKTQQTIIAYQSQEILTPTTIPPTSSPNLPSVTPTFTPAPTLIPTSTPIPTLNPLPSSKPQPTPTSTPVPTLILAPTVVPTTPPQSENTQITEQKKIAAAIKETRGKLDKIKKDLEEKREERIDREDREENEKRHENQKRDKEK